MVGYCSTAVAFWQRTKRCAQSQSLQFVGAIIVLAIFAAIRRAAYPLV
jgi:hypothetical protein